MIFENRTEAGKKLASELTKLNLANPYIIALPRGGVPVAYEVSKALNAPLDIAVVRKLGFPNYPELGFGAIAPGGITVLNTEMVNQVDIEKPEMVSVVIKEEQEMIRRQEKYKGGNSLPELTNKTAIIIDDGIATGITLQAAVSYVKLFNPKQIIIATPVCSPDALDYLKSRGLKIVTLTTPFNFGGVGQWYKEFRQTSDEEVINLLNKPLKNETR